MRERAEPRFERGFDLVLERVDLFAELFALLGGRRGPSAQDRGQLALLAEHLGAVALQLLLVCATAKRSRKRSASAARPLSISELASDMATAGTAAPTLQSAFAASSVSF